MARIISKDKNQTILVRAISLKIVFTTVGVGKL